MNVCLNQKWLLRGWLLPVLLLILNIAGAQSDTSKADKKDLRTLETKVGGIETGLKQLIGDTSKFQRKTATDAAKNTEEAKSKCEPCKDKLMGFWDYVLVFVPAILFLTILIILLSNGLSDFDLKKAMSENAYPIIRVDNPQYTEANLKELAANENLEDVLPATIERTYLIGGTTVKTNPDGSTTTTTSEPPPPNPSVSRYIAFITSILTIVVALGISCFYIYHYIRTGCPPELTGISTLLIALGIGVMPYAVNKLAGAIGKSKDDSV